TNEANWTAPNNFVVGEKGSAITRLAVAPTGALYIFKTDGIYTLDPFGEDHELYPSLRFAPEDENGVAWGVFLNDLYVRYGDSLYRIDPNGVIDGVGPEK